MGGQSGHHAPLCAGLSAPHDLPLGVSLVHKITGGEAREEIWSSVNYFFISTPLIYRKNRQARQGFVIKILKVVLGPEVSTAWGYLV